MSTASQPATDGFDAAFHYPPDLFEQLVDTIPLLCRSKNAVLLFFQGAGVPAEDLDDIRGELKADASAHNKYGITRTILTRLNERGDNGLRSRREVVKRVVEFEDFGTTWDNDRMRAKGQVASIRERVNVHDAFTRMSMERDREAARHRETHERQQEEVRSRTAAIDGARDRLFALFGEQNPQRRGKLAEAALNDIFAAFGISVREAFELRGDDGEGIVEQIDGVVDIDGTIYLVEMKWLSQTAGTGIVAQHLVRVMGRSGARGMIIANPGFSDAAVKQVRDAMGHMTVVLVTLEEIVGVLSRGDDLTNMLRTKIQAAVIDREPFRRI
ncbi:restriction endonuclease [Sphingomonas sp. GM_Shp_2]|uniref:restriction endonuclease n=1 Tax=Sphingomonas sp. GM_Shp_2 TaxID=2937380 RepID=UPI00226AE587|nr:restriction endonuclease [Sphingomonas sp. GM_Shp_2]